MARPTTAKLDQQRIRAAALALAADPELYAERYPHLRQAHRLATPRPPRRTGKFRVRA